MRYLTKEWYIACQADPMTPEVQKQLTGPIAPRRRARRCRTGCYSNFSSTTAWCGKSSPGRISRFALTARIPNTIP